MEIRKVSESYNPVLRRKELSFFIDHTSLSSPKLYEVRKGLAEKYGVGEDAIYVMKLKTETGTNRTYGKAEVYDSLGDAEKIVPKHIQTRNSAARREKKEKETKS